MILLQGLTTFYHILEIKKKSGQTLVLQQFVHFSIWTLAAELGFEPRQTESESAVLPLHNTAICFAVFLSFRLFPSDNVVYYSRYSGKVNPFFKKTLKIWNLFFEWELKRVKKRGIMRFFAFSAVYGLCQKTRAESLRHTLCGIFR